MSKVEMFSRLVENTAALAGAGVLGFAVWVGSIEWRTPSKQDIEQAAQVRADVAHIRKQVDSLVTTTAALAAAEAARVERERQTQAAIADHESRLRDRERRP